MNVIGCELEETAWSVNETSWSSSPVTSWSATPGGFTPSMPASIAFWTISGTLEKKLYPVSASTASTRRSMVVPASRSDRSCSGRCSRFGMMTAIVRVEASDAGDVVAALGQDEDDLPGEGGNGHVSSASVVATPPLDPVPPTPAGPDTMYSSFGGRERAEVVLEVGPGALVVVRRLRDHVRHQERGLVDGERVVAGRGPRSASCGRGRSRCRGSRWPGRDTSPAGPRDRRGTCPRARGRPIQSSLEVPAHPVRRALVAVVGERELLLRHQVVVRRVEVRLRSRGIAHREMDVGRIRRRCVRHDREREDVVRGQRVGVRRRCRRRPGRGPGP